MQSFKLQLSDNNSPTAFKHCLSTVINHLCQVRFGAKIFSKITARRKEINQSFLKNPKLFGKDYHHVNTLQTIASVFDFKLKMSTQSFHLKSLL